MGDDTPTPPEPRKRTRMAPVVRDDRATVKMPPIAAGDRMTIEFSDPDKVAAFFELAARLVRERKKITVVIE